MLEDDATGEDAEADEEPKRLTISKLSSKSPVYIV